jgi:hypothetical protein
VPLLAHGIGLAQPLADLIVELVRRFDPELVDMVSRSDRLDIAKPRVLQAPGENQMAIEPARRSAPSWRSGPAQCYSTIVRPLFVC